MRSRSLAAEAELPEGHEDEKEQQGLKEGHEDELHESDEEDEQPESESSEDEMEEQDGAADATATATAVTLAAAASMPPAAMEASLAAGADQPVKDSVIGQGKKQGASFRKYDEEVDYEWREWTEWITDRDYTVDETQAEKELREQMEDYGIRACMPFCPTTSAACLKNCCPVDRKEQLESTSVCNFFAITIKGFAKSSDLLGFIYWAIIIKISPGLEGTREVPVVQYFPRHKKKEAGKNWQWEHVRVRDKRGKIKRKRIAKRTDGERWLVETEGVLKRMRHLTMYSKVERFSVILHTLVVALALDAALGWINQLLCFDESVVGETAAQVYKFLVAAAVQPLGKFFLCTWFIRWIFSKGMESEKRGCERIIDKCCKNTLHLFAALVFLVTGVICVIALGLEESVKGKCTPKDITFEDENGDVQWDPPDESSIGFFALNWLLGETLFAYLYHVIGLFFFTTIGKDWQIKQFFLR